MPVCALCGATETVTRKGGWVAWYNNPNGRGLICNACACSRAGFAGRGIKRRPHPDSAKAKMRAAKLGKKLSQAHKDKIGAAHKGAKNPNYGKKLSDELKKKLSDAHLGQKSWNKGKSGYHINKVVTPQERAALSKRMTENNPTKRPEVRQKLKAFRATLKLPRRDTRPEKMVRAMLNEMKLSFVEQKAVNMGWAYHQCDFFVESANLVIEADGNFPHGNPNPYRSVRRGGKLSSSYRPGYKGEDHRLGNENMKDVWEYDRKVTDSLLAMGFNVLRLWESELDDDMPGCIKRIDSIFIQ